MASDRQGLERLRTWWDYLRTSLWFVPTLMACLGVALAVGGAWFDSSLAASEERSWFIYVSEKANARQVLSTLLSSLITMASLVFSITMVVLTLAANQFGPRLIRSFMASPQTQLVLGMFIMTIVYCLLTLAAIGSRGDGGLHPYPTVSLAIALALGSVALLVLYLHVLARSIVSETVIERVGAELDELLDDMPPLADGEEETAGNLLPGDFEQRAAFVGTCRAGYVQAIGFATMVELARAADVRVGLRFQPGDFVAEGGQGIGVYPGERLDEELAARLAAAVLVGTHRTPNQDPGFAIRHLVEIAVRALSPGINDPFTAVSVINQLSASYGKLMTRALPSGVHRDQTGTPRVLCPRPTHASLVGAGFDQIRQNGADKPVIVIHLLEAVERVADRVARTKQLDALTAQLRIIIASAERAVADPVDVGTIAERASRARDALARAGERLRSG